MPTPEQLRQEASALLDQTIGKNRSYAHLIWMDKVSLFSVEEKTKKDIHHLLNDVIEEERWDRTEVLAPEIQGLLSFALQGKEGQTLWSFILTALSTHIHDHADLLDSLHHSGMLLAGLTWGPNIHMYKEMEIQQLQDLASKKLLEIRNMITPTPHGGLLSNKLIEMCFSDDTHIHDNLEIVSYILSLADLSPTQEIEAWLPHGLSR